MAGGGRPIPPGLTAARYTGYTAVVDDERPEWLQRAGAAYPDSRRWRVVMDGLTHAVVRAPGRACWVGRYNFGGRSPAEYLLFDKRQPHLRGLPVGQGRLTPGLRNEMRRKMLAAQDGRA